MSLPTAVEERILAKKPGINVGVLRGNFTKAVASLDQRERFASKEARDSTRALRLVKQTRPEIYAKKKNDMVHAEIRRRMKNKSIVLEEGKFVELCEDNCGVHQIDNRLSKMLGSRKKVTM